MKKWSFGIRMLMLITIIFALFTAVFLSLLIFVPDGLEIRAWYETNLSIMIWLSWFGIEIIWIAVLRRKVWPFCEGLWKKIAVVVIVVAMCLLLVGINSMQILWILFQNHTELRNENGTLIVRIDHWLDPADYELHEKEGILYRRYLRPSDGPDDIDPTITYEQYLELKEQEKEALIAEYSENNETIIPEVKEYVDESDEEYKSKTDEGVIDGTDREYVVRQSRVEEGYQAVCEQYLSVENDLFREDYDVRGNTRYILYEDEKEIRYIMYDRDSDNKACAMYVYYKAEKASDGFWSPVDAAILDIFAYRFSDGKVADSQKSTWSDPGTLEYRDMTGE